MNKTILIAALSLSLLPSVHAQTAAAAPAAPAGVLSDLSVNGTLDLESQYIFRGKKVTNAALQPSVNINYGNVAGGTVTGYMWTSQPIGRSGGNATTGIPSAGPNQNNEIDLGVKYDNTIPSYSAWGYELGFQMYWYPNFSGQTNWLSRSYELHVGLSYDTTDLMNSMGWGKYNIQPSLTYFHDVVLDSNTLQAQLASYTFTLDDAVGLKGVTLTPTATLGWTGIHDSFGDQLVAGTPNWNNSYWYYELDLELDYKPNGTGTTTFFTGVHYAGNTDGTTGGFGGLSPQAVGSPNSIWFGFGVKFNQ